MRKHDDNSYGLGPFMHCFDNSNRARYDWGSDFEHFGEFESEVPTPPKRAGTGYDCWWANCGQVVTQHDEVLSQRSTPWTKALREWTYEARKTEAAEELRVAVNILRVDLQFLTMRLRETEVGKHLHKKRKMAEMNARYVKKGGKRIYVGKRKNDERKRKRAEAARVRRALKRAETHDEMPSA